MTLGIQRDNCFGREPIRKTVVEVRAGKHRNGKDAGKVIRKRVKGGR